MKTKIKREPLVSDATPCLDAVVEYTNSKQNEWVLKDFKCSTKKTTRNYFNQFSGETITTVVLNKSGVIFLRDYQTMRDKKSKCFRTLAELKSNPITINLLPIVINLMEEYDSEDDYKFSGRIVYSLNYDCGDCEDFELWNKEHELQFYCGPETKEGAIDDSGKGIIDEKLYALFADMSIDVQIAESLHSVYFPEGIDARDIWGIVEERLIRSGAKPMKG
jgi:hypothetical protein